MGGLYFLDGSGNGLVEETRVTHFVPSMGAWLEAPIRNGRRLPNQGGQDMITKKVLFPAWWFLPLITERAPPV